MSDELRRYLQERRTGYRPPGPPRLRGARTLAAIGLAYVMAGGLVLLLALL